MRSLSNASRTTGRDAPNIDARLCSDGSRSFSEKRPSLIMPTIFSYTMSLSRVSLLEEADVVRLSICALSSQIAESSQHFISDVIKCVSTGALEADQLQTANGVFDCENFIHE